MKQKIKKVVKDLHAPLGAMILVFIFCLITGQMDLLKNDDDSSEVIEHKM